MRRTLIGLSQAKLGEALGLTFQQVQKYEKGTNRIGASRLHDIATVLEVPVEFFHEGAPVADGLSGGFDRGSANRLADQVITDEHLQLLKAFARISNDQVRRRLIKLLEAMASDS